MTIIYNLGAVYRLAGVIILVMMACLWIISVRIRNTSIADIFWGIGFILIAWATHLSFQDANLNLAACCYTFVPAIFGHAPFFRDIFLTILVTIWGLRLSLHILARNWGQPEDFRYAEWRTENGARWWWISFFKVFLLQGILMFIIAMPLMDAQVPASDKFPARLDLIGFLVWIIGFLFESIGDLQLTRFKSNPANRGTVLTTGLWKYTRHPNYFGEAVLWWGFWLIACAAGAWWTVFSPILMTFLLLRVSGVSLLEKSLKETKPGYAEYIRTTSTFLPWPPKKG